MYALVDRDQESIFNFTLAEALRSKELNGALFKNFIFCVTPQVVPSIDLLTPIISAAGGTVLRKMPTIDEIVRYSETQFHIKNQQQLIVISCYKDDQYVATLQGKPCVHLCTADFILDGVLRQTIDFMKHKINMEINRSNGNGNSSNGNNGLERPIELRNVFTNNSEMRKTPSSGICEDNNYIPNTPVYKHSSATTP